MKVFPSKNEGCSRFFSLLHALKSMRKSRESVKTISRSLAKHAMLNVSNDQASASGICTLTSSAIARGDAISFRQASN